ncbi:MAG TPA: hypothetical protein VEQ61_11600 [Thermoleophilaceae bacterium]|nr:hypothetical protein [Thermoleophilaceae bacterium]
MAAKRKAAKAGTGAVAAGKAVRSNPYVQRLIEDPELRENLRVAFDSTKKAYARMSNGKAPAKALMDDKKVRRDLKEAATSLREAGDSLRGAKKRKRGGRLMRVLLLALVGGGAALAGSEGLRKKALDALFGAEEEFEYTSTTTPDSSAGSGTVSTSGSSEPVGTA